MSNMLRKDLTQPITCKYGEECCRSFVPESKPKQRRRGRAQAKASLSGWMVEHGASTTNVRTAGEMMRGVLALA